MYCFPSFFKDMLAGNVCLYLTGKEERSWENAAHAVSADLGIDLVITALSITDMAYALNHSTIKHPPCVSKCCAKVLGRCKEKKKCCNLRMLLNSICVTVNF